MNKDFRYSNNLAKRLVCSQHVVETLSLFIRMLNDNYRALYWTRCSSRSDVCVCVFVCPDDNV